MAIKKYTENGKDLFQVYINLRSPTSKLRIQRKSKGFKTEAEARREERKLTIEATRDLERMDGRGIWWGDLVHLWGTEVKMGYLGKISPRSAEGYLSIIRKWTASWNELPAREINRAYGRDLIMKLDRDGVAKSYQKKIKNIIGSVFEWAVQIKHLPYEFESPFLGIYISKGEEKPPQILSLAEIKKFLHAAKLLDHVWYPVWSFAILTGMRSGELHALTWDQIDLEKGTILVDRSYDSNTGTVGPTKGRYWRTVPINSSLRDLIIELKSKEINDSGNHVLPRLKEWDNGDQAVSLQAFLTSLKMKPVKFHTLRACFATQMLANGVSAPIVMKIGGWKKSATMDIYLRLAGVETKGATDCLEFLPENISFGDNVVSLNDRRAT
jgi:integrase